MILLAFLGDKNDVSPSPTPLNTSKNPLEVISVEKCNLTTGFET